MSCNFRRPDLYLAEPGMIASFQIHFLTHLSGNTADSDVPGRLEFEEKFEEEKCQTLNQSLGTVQKGMEEAQVCICRSLTPLPPSLPPSLHARTHTHTNNNNSNKLTHKHTLCTIAHIHVIVLIESVEWMSLYSSLFGSYPEAMLDKSHEQPTDSLTWVLLQLLGYCYKIPNLVVTQNAPNLVTAENLKVLCQSYY